MAGIQYDSNASDAVIDNPIAGLRLGVPGAAEHNLPPSPSMGGSAADIAAKYHQKTVDALASQIRKPQPQQGPLLGYNASTDQFATGSGVFSLGNLSEADAIVQKGVLNKGLPELPAGFQQTTPEEIQRAIQYRASNRGAWDATKEVGRNVVTGAVSGIPEMAGKATQYFAPDEGLGQQAGAGLRNFADYTKEKMGGAPDTLGRGEVASTFINAGSSLAPSLTGMVASIAAPELAIPAVIALFGGSQAQDTYEKAIAAGKDKATASEAAMQTGAIEGIGEAIADVIGGKLILGGGKILQALTRAGRVTTEEAVRIATDPKMLAQFAKSMAGTMGSEMATEFGQSYGEAAVEKDYGISNDDPLSQGLEGAKTAAAMTAMLALFGLRAHHQQASQRAALGKAINDFDHPVDMLSAATIISKQIEPSVGLDASQQWLEGKEAAGDAYIENMVPDIKRGIFQEQNQAIDRQEIANRAPSQQGPEAEPSQYGTTDLLNNRIERPNSWDYKQWWNDVPDPGTADATSFNKKGQFAGDNSPYQRFWQLTTDQQQAPAETPYAGLTIGKMKDGERAPIPLHGEQGPVTMPEMPGVGENTIKTTNPYGSGATVGGTVRPTQTLAPSTFTPTPAEVKLAKDTEPTVAPVTAEQRLKEQGKVVPAATAVPAVRLPQNIQLTDKQRPVFEYMKQAMESNQQDEIVDAEGVLQYQNIAEKFGIARGSAKSFIDRIAQKMAVAAGKSLAEMKTALRERAITQRTVAPSDMESRGLSPALQTSEINETDILGSEDGAEQSMGVINSVGGSQGEIGKDEQLPASYVDSVDPSDKAKAEAEANRAAGLAEAEQRLTEPEAVTAALDYNDAKSEGSPTFEELTVLARGEFVAQYQAQISTDDSWNAIAAMQRDFERALEPSDVERNAGKLQDTSTNPEPAGQSSGTARIAGPSESSAAPVETAEDPSNPLEARLAKLQDFLGGKQKGAVKRLIDRYTNDDITLERLVGELENYEAQVKDGVRFSESSQGGADATKITATLKKLFFSPERFDKIVKVVQSIRDLKPAEYAALSQADDPNQVQAFTTPDGKVVIIAGNVQPGQELGVFLHEVGVHIGMEKLIGAGNLVKLVSQVKEWAAKADGSQESNIAIEAVRRAGTSSSTNTEEEHIAYFIEEAVKAGIDPTAVERMRGPLASWFRTLWAAAKTALRKMGLNRFDQLTAQNLVDLAYGAAQLELGKPDNELASGHESITIEAPSPVGADIERAQQLFLSAFPKSDGYVHYRGVGDKSSELARLSKAASDTALDELDGSPTTSRTVGDKLGPFTGFDTRASTEKGLDGQDQLVIKVYGKEQVAAGLTEHPALTMTIGRDGEYSIYAPPSDSATYSEFEKRGWAEPATGRDGEPASISGDKFWTRLTGSSSTEVIGLLADAHARAREWLGAENVGLHWQRTTGATGGESGRKGAIFFSEVRKVASRVAGSNGEMFYDDTTHALKKLTYSMASLHDLVDEFKAALPSVKAWYEGVQNSISARKRYEGDAELIASAADKLKNGTAKVNDFISRATFEQKWGYDPKFSNRSVTVDPAMAKAFNALSPEEQKVVKDVFAHGEKMQLAKQKILNSLGIAQTFSGAGKLDGPYAPLKRFGKYIGQLKSKELRAAEVAEDKKLISKLKADPDHYVMSMFDTMGQAKQFAQANAGKWAFTDAFEKSTRVGEVRDMPADVLSKVLSAVKMDDEIPANARDAMKNLITDMYFAAQDEYNARTAGLKRLNRAGFDADMIRSFLTHARAEAGFMANMEHGGAINDAFYKMQGEAKGDTGHRVSQDAFNTIASHYAENLKYDETPWQDRAMALTSAWQLATSIGYHVTNAMQGFMVTIPKLGSDFGNYRGAWTHLLAGYGVLKHTGMWGNIDLSKVANVGLREALQKASDMGVLDVGMEEDLTRFDATRTGHAAIDKTTGAARTALHLLRRMSRGVETANRVSAAAAGYNMSIGAGKSVEAAQDYAIRLLQTTQGDFSRVGSPLLLKRLPKVMTQYRKYQFMMGALYAKAFRDAFMSANPVVKKIGRRMLAYKMFHTTMAAGVLGMPMMNLVGLVFSALGGDGEPEDLERTLRELIGDKELASLLLHGPLAALGLDMSAKLGDDKVFSIMPYGDWDFTSAAGVGKTAVSLMGPAVAQAGKFADGVGAIQDGDYYKGLEKFMPKGIESGMKAFRIANEGYSLKNGDVMFRPEDINGFALALDAIGMPSSELKRMDWLRGQQYEIKKFYTDHSIELTKKYAKASKSGNTDAMAQLRKDWMELQDGKDNLRRYFGDSATELKRQPLSNLLKAPVATQKRETKLQRAAQVE